MNKGLLLFAATILLILLSCNASSARLMPFGGYEPLAKVLSQYVDDEGKVNYAALKENSSDLDDFVASIVNTNIEVFSQNEKKAFWINAYNALTLKTVVDKYPVKSIRLINFGLVWKMPKNVAHGKFSLGDIEHNILRKMGDPRVHFAINCASGGCPKLSQRPFYPETLDQQLNAEAKRFINDKEKVRLDRENNVLYYSAILDWFEEDFLVVEKDILSYIKKYIREEDREYLEQNTVQLKVLDYDWNLNKQ